MTVTVRRSGVPDTVGEFAWTISPLPPALHPVVVSNAPIGTPLRWWAISIAAAGAVGAAAQWRRRRSSVDHAQHIGRIAPESSGISAEMLVNSRAD